MKQNEFTKRIEKAIGRPIEVGTMNQKFEGGVAKVSVDFQLVPTEEDKAKWAEVFGIDPKAMGNFKIGNLIFFTVAQ
jgi:hypothetical protein